MAAKKEDYFQVILDRMTAKRENGFQVILVDPAWEFVTYSEKGAGRSPSAHYDTMTFEHMLELDVRRLAADDSALFMWVVDWLPQSVAEGLASAWGFDYKTRAWVWIKQNPTGWGFFTGKGFYTRANPEDCLLFTRGRMPVPSHARPHSVMREPIDADDLELPFIYAPVMRHSKKPPEQYSRIERMYPAAKYPNRLELFAREKQPNWLSLGNEIDGRDLRDSIPALAKQIERKRNNENEKK